MCGQCFWLSILSSCMQVMYVTCNSEVWRSGNVIGYPAKHYPVSAWCFWPTWNGNSLCVFNIFNSFLLQAGVRNLNLQNISKILLLISNANTINFRVIYMKIFKIKICIWPKKRTYNATKNEYFWTTFKIKIALSCKRSPAM